MNVMMIEKSEILVALKGLVLQVGHPLSETRISDGWSPEAQKAISKLLHDIYVHIQNDTCPPPVRLSVGFDHWGIRTTCPIGEEAAKISLMLEQYCRPYNL